MVFDKLAEAFNGQNVRLLLTDSGLNEDFNLYNMTKKKGHPRNRVHSRGGAKDFYGPSLREVTYETVITEQMFKYLDSNSELNTRHAMPQIAGQVISDSLSGVGADDMTENFTFEIADLEDQSIDENYWWVRVHMIIVPGTYSIAA